MNVILYGDRTTDLSTISHAIDYSFDLYRKNLETMMENFSKFIRRIDWIDEKYNETYKSIHDEIQGFVLQLPYYWEDNEVVLRELLKPWDIQLTYAIMPPHHNHHHLHHKNLSSEPMKPTEPSRKDVPAYNSLAQVIIHLTRDWSAIGTNIRKSLYFDTLIPLVEKFVTKPDDMAPLILIPGSGLGRLGIELIARGYRVELNECSASMFCAMNTIMSKLLPNQKQLSFYPYLHYLLTDDWDLSRRTVTTEFPYITDSAPTQTFFQQEHIKAHLLSIQFGEFARVYGESVDRGNMVEVVITCFFIDTAENIFEYLEAIKNVLKSGGIWINAGPLHYHSANSLPYSFVHLLKIIELSGFETLHQSKLNMTYCGEEEYSMKPELYNIPITVFRLSNKQ